MTTIILMPASCPVQTGGLIGRQWCNDCIAVLVIGFFLISSRCSQRLVNLCLCKLNRLSVIQLWLEPTSRFRIKTMGKFSGQTSDWNVFRDQERQFSSVGLLITFCFSHGVTPPWSPGVQPPLWEIQEENRFQNPILMHKGVFHMQCVGMCCMLKKTENFLNLMDHCAAFDEAGWEKHRFENWRNIPSKHLFVGTFFTSMHWNKAQQTKACLWRAHSSNVRLCGRCSPSALQPHHNKC